MAPRPQQERGEGGAPGGCAECSGETVPLLQATWEEMTRRWVWEGRRRAGVLPWVLLSVSSVQRKVPVPHLRPRDTALSLARACGTRCPRTFPRANQRAARVPRLPALFLQVVPGLFAAVHGESERGSEAPLTPRTPARIASGSAAANGRPLGSGLLPRGEE